MSDAPTSTPALLSACAAGVLARCVSDLMRDRGISAIALGKASGLKVATSGEVVDRAVAGLLALRNRSPEESEQPAERLQVTLDRATRRRVHLTFDGETEAVDLTQADVEAYLRRVGAVDRVADLLAGDYCPTEMELAALAAALGVTPPELVQPDAYSASEVAAMTGVSRDTVVKWLHRGRLAGERGENGRWMIPAAVALALGGKPPAQQTSSKTHPPEGDLGVKIFARIRTLGLGGQVQVVRRARAGNRSSTLTQGRLSTIIRGKVDPSVKQLAEIARALEMTPDALLLPATDEERRIVDEALKSMAPST